MHLNPSRRTPGTLFTGLFAAALLLACAGTNSSTPMPENSALNPCADIRENQEAIQRIQVQIKDLTENMNDENKKELTKQIENLQEQIKGLNKSSADKLQACQPANLNNPGTK